MGGTIAMHKEYMMRALELAKQGRGYVNPNPMVGAVIVKNGKIIGEGYHQRFGDKHAEMNAIVNAQDSVQDATMYVTLEPCSHFGKTPPCAKALIDYKIKEVYVASRDPNPLVAGRGIQMLQEAGIIVHVGLLDQENKLLNRVFFKYIQTKKPYVIMKSAMTVDGKTASYAHDSKWITNDASRTYVHQLRQQLSAVMIGVNTVAVDDPMLTVRFCKDCTNQPTRIILDTYGEISLEAKVVQTANEFKTIVATTSHCTNEKIKQLQALGVKVLVTPLLDDNVDLPLLMQMIGADGIDSILLEGGSFVNFSALDGGIVDEVIVFVAPKIIGGQHALTPVGGRGKEKIQDGFMLELQSIKQFGEDVCLTYFVKKG